MNKGGQLSEEPEVRLIASLQGGELSQFQPSDLSVYGAMSCFSGKTSHRLLEEDLEKLPPEKREAKKDRILSLTSGRGHGSVLDQAVFTFSIKNLTRAATLLFCAPEFLAHLQQSHRRVREGEGYALPDEITSSPLKKEVLKKMDECFETYSSFLEEEVPMEDARMMLPLYSRTNIQTQGNVRELMHLHSMSQRPGVPSLVRKVVDDMMSRAGELEPKLVKRRKSEYYDNYEVLAWFPSSQFYAPENKTLKKIINDYGRERAVLLDFSGIKPEGDKIEEAVKKKKEEELANLKHLHFTFLVPMSIACFHQATRQRTWNQSVESVYQAVERSRIAVPPSVESAGLKKEYGNQCSSLLELYEHLVEEGVPASEAIGVIPHALEVYDLVHVNGWNAIHSIGKRTCFEAQWEIRKKAMEMALLVKKAEPGLGKFAEPQGRIYGKCPEESECDYCFTDTSMEELYEKLHGKN